MDNQKPKKSLLRRILKWSGITLLVIIILLIAAPFIFKDKIVAIVKEQANKNLNAKVDFGDFDLSLISSFPDFRFKIQNVSVIGIDEFKDDTLAFITEIKTDINIKSVISGDKYRINSVIIDQPHILAKVLPNGKANWDIAKPSTDSTGKPSQEPSKFSMDLEELKIKNAFITYDDQKGAMYASLQDFNYEMNGDFTQDNFVMNNLIDIAKTTVKMGAVSYLAGVKTHIKADVDVDMPKKKYVLKENVFALNDLELDLDGMVEMPDTVNTRVDIKFKTNKADFKSLLSLIPAVFTKDFAGLKASGKLTLDGFAKGTYNGKSYPSFAVNLGIENGMFKYPALPKSVNNVNVAIKVDDPGTTLDEMVIDVSKFHVEMAGNPIDLAAHVKTPMSDPGLRAEVKGIIDLGSVKEFIPLDKGDALNGTIKSDISIAGHMSALDKKEYDKFKATGALEVDKMNYTSAAVPYGVVLNVMKMNFTNQYVELASFDAKMGNSDIQANGKIENFMQYLFKNDLIKGTFNLNSNLMDLNQLMGPPSTSTAAATASTAPTSTASSGVMDVPGNIDFTLNSKINKVLYTNLVIENMVGNIVVRDKKVDMTNLKMNTMGGDLTINGYYETSNIKKPTTALNLKVENFDIQSTYKSFGTVQKLAPIGQYATGKFTATLENFNTSLNDKMEPDLNSVKAHGIFKTDKVVVGGFPPFEKLGEALKMDQLKKQELTNVSLNYELKDGRISMAPFNTKISNIPTTISGSTGLDQTIDYKWKMEIPKSMFGGAASSALDGLLKQANSAAGTNMAVGDKVNVTANFGGTVTKPVIKTSLKDEAKNAVATATTQAVNTAIDKANAEAQKILEDAKAQCEKNKAEAQANAEKQKQEGYAAADQLVEQAGNPIAKVAAKKAAEAAKKKVDEKVQKILDDAEAKCQKQLEEAKAKADAKAAENKK